MIQVIALTQFVFVALGVAALKILIQADSGTPISTTLQQLDRLSLWLFLIPVLWIGFASLCQIVKRPPLTLVVARVTGVIVAILTAAFLISVTFLTSL